MAILNSKVSSPVNAGGVAGSALTGNITIPAGSFYATTGAGITTGATYTYSTGAGMNGSWGTAVSTAHPSLQVTGDAEFEGNVKIKGKDLAKSLEAIEQRLAILVPDPKKLEKFEALQKAYAHYKLLEALCNGDDDDK